MPREGVPAVTSPNHADAYPSYATYNPADYPPASAGAAREPHLNPAYGESDLSLGQPNPNDTFAGDRRYDDPAAEAAAARELQEEREMQQERDWQGRASKNDPGNVSTFERDAPEVLENRASMSADMSHSTPSSTSEATRSRADVGNTPS